MRERVSQTAAACQQNRLQFYIVCAANLDAAVGREFNLDGETVRQGDDETERG